MADKEPYGDVSYADPGYQSDNQKRYPIDTAEHAKAAWSYINQAGNAGKYTASQLSAIKGRIKAAMHKFGMSTEDDASRSDELDPDYELHLISDDPIRVPEVASNSPTYSRYVPLDDVSVRTVGTGRSEGREVTAYAAVFNTPAEIHDQDGHYIEELDPVIFNRAVSDSRPQGSRKNWRVGVFYNHGMTILGTPSDRHSMPVGVPKEIKPDGHGLLTVTTYHRSQFADEIVEGLESGAIPGYSFSGRFMRSNPMIPRGGFRSGSGGLRTVRRMESTLKEYGPTPFPAYAEAGITGIRSDTLLYTLLAGDPEMAKVLNALRSVIRDGDPTNVLDAPLPVDSSPKDSQPVEAQRSSRLLKRQMDSALTDFRRRFPEME